MSLVCSSARIELGAYVVGALDRRTRLEVDQHVTHCARCRDQLAALAPLPGLLRRLRPADVEAAVIAAARATWVARTSTAAEERE